MDGQDLLSSVEGSEMQNKSTAQDGHWGRATRCLMAAVFTKKRLRQGHDAKGKGRR